MSVITKDLGAVTAYAAAVNRGYTGTKEEFETLMASYATVAQQAQASATSAGQSATDASQSATDAETAKGTAQQAATDAQTAQTQAQGYAQSAQTAAQDAQGYAQTAESAKDTAVDAVDGFAAGAQQALDSVNQAGNNWKSLAQAKALDSEAYAQGTRDGEDVGSSDPAYHNNAKWYAESAATDATTASDAAQTATTKASEAAQSASAAAESARTLTIDRTLTQSGQAADSKVVGDEIGKAKEYINYQEFKPTTNNYMIGTIIGNPVILSSPTQNWVYSETPLRVKKGETVHCKTRASGMCAIATAPTEDFSGAVCRVAANNNDSVGEYKYVAERDCFAWISGRVNETFGYVDYMSLYDVASSVSGNVVYTVKKDGSGDYSTFSGMLDALKDDTREKTVFVYPGVYDIFEEMGGSSYIQSIDNPTALNWKNVNKLVPENTRIVGVGNVVLSYEPEDSEIVSGDHAFLFAALNISDVSCKVENITINAKNCRYAVHIENGQSEKPIDMQFSNVRVNMGTGGVRNAQAVGTGVGNNSKWAFRNCVVSNETSSGCFTSHTNVPLSNDSASIIFEGCVFTITGQTASGNINIVQLISAYNTTPADVKNYAKFISCYATGKIALVNGYDSRPVTKKQLFDFTAINCICGGIFVSNTFEDSEPVNRY